MQLQVLLQRLLLLAILAQYQPVERNVHIGRLFFLPPIETCRHTKGHHCGRGLLVATVHGFPDLIWVRNQHVGLDGGGHGGLLVVELTSLHE